MVVSFVNGASRPLSPLGVFRYRLLSYTTPRNCSSILKLRIEKINAVCDSSLNNEYNQDMAINKIKAIYLRDGEKNAKIYLSKLLRTHPSPLLKFLNEDWNEWIRMNNEEFELMNIKTLR